MKAPTIASVAFIAWNCLAGTPQTDKAQSFEWTNRLELTAEQQQLLHVYSGLRDENSSPEKRGKLEADAKRISDSLGSAKVRQAKPEELIVRSEKPGISIVLNPSDENLAFTVSVRGDEERIGTQMASMGRLTYLPPKAELRVPDMYWTTPRMAHKN